MRIGERRRRTRAALRALRYYEERGLVVPSRHPNGYRDYAEVSVSQVQQIRELTRLGLTVEADASVRGVSCGRVCRRQRLRVLARGVPAGDR